MVKGNGNNYAFVDSQNLNLGVHSKWPNYEKALIVSGDGDFHCLIEHLDAYGKL